MNMYSDLQSFHEQFTKSLNILASIDLSSLQEIKRIYFAGMGGSSLVADLVNDYLQLSDLIHIVRDYSLPKNVNKEDLVICSSYSGNTEETLAVFDMALHAGHKIVAMTHGGTLLKKAQAEEIPLIYIPECSQPRVAIGHFFTSVIGLLDRLKKIQPHQSIIENLALSSAKKQKNCEKKGKELSQVLLDKVPIIYGPNEFYGACRIWKIKFNENSKIPSFFNVFPELNHNEMVGWTRLNMKPSIIYLISQFMHPRISKRMTVMEDLLSSKIPFYHVRLTGKNILEEIFESILIADYASYYLAVNAGVDPAPVEMVESFKKKLTL